MLDEEARVRPTDARPPGRGLVERGEQREEGREPAPLVRNLLTRIDAGERDELRREKLAELRSLMESE